MIESMLMATYYVAMFIGCIWAILTMLFGGGICFIYLTEWIKDLRK